jgi:hypothetical protein
MNLSDYKESKAKQESGSPCYIGDGGSYFDVKRIHTPEYTKQIEDIKKQEYGFAPKEIDNNLILATWLCEYGVTGWEGVIDGEEITYSKRNARKIFLNPDYFMSLNALLIQHASDYNNYLYDEVIEDIETIKKS